MTDTLREIEKGHEAKYKLNEELRFKIRCRRNKLFGLWAAEHLGKSGGGAEGYAKALVRIELERASSNVLEQVLADFGDAGVTLPTADVVAALQRCQAQAAEQIAQDYPMPLDVDHVQVGG